MPMIAFMLARVSRVKRVDQIVVATSDDASDDALADCVREQGYTCHRGSLDDVLSRFHGAAAAAGADLAVRLTGDCPLMDPELVETVVERLAVEPGLSYVSNVAPPTFPDGLDVEAFTFDALEAAYREARLGSDREHVTPFIRNHGDRFRSANVRGLGDMSHLRWTIDYEDDLKFVTSLLAAAGIDAPSRGDRFDFYRVLEAHPHLLTINQHGRNEGLVKSLLADKMGTP
jgi:spore coat polysaccharide biosynthesis protein SpsF